MRKKGLLPLILGLLLLTVFASAAFAPEFFTSYSQKELFTKWLPMSREHLLGTNAMGYDILTELIYGARQTLLVGVLSSILTLILGAGIGILGSFRGWIGQIFNGLIQIFVLLPKLITLIVLATFFGSSAAHLIVLIAAFSWVGTARAVRLCRQRIPLSILPNRRGRTLYQGRIFLLFFRMGMAAKIFRNALQAFLQQRAIVQAHVPSTAPGGLERIPRMAFAARRNRLHLVGNRAFGHPSDDPIPFLNRRGQCSQHGFQRTDIFLRLRQVSPSACEKFLDGALSFDVPVALVFAQNSVAECFDIHRRTPSLFGFAFLFQYTIAPFRFQSSKPFVSRLFRCVPGTVPTLAAARRRA